MRYIPTYTLIYEKLIWSDILNLERDVVITLENKFNVRISGYNVYCYDKKNTQIWKKLFTLYLHLKIFKCLY